MHLGHVGRRRRQPGADRPDRLIGDHQIGARSRHRAASRRAGGRSRRASGRPRARRAVRRRRRSPSSPARRAAMRLGAHLRVGFVMVGAPLGMADDHGARRRRRSAFRRRYRRYGRRTARHGNPAPPIATAEPRAAAAKLAIRVAGGQTIRSALAASAAAPCDDLGELAHRGGKPVHLPVARDQRA